MISVNVETAKRLYVKDLCLNLVKISYVMDLKEEHSEDKTQNFN